MGGEPHSQRILDRLKQRKAELGISYDKIADNAFDYGLRTPKGKRILDAKKIWQIMQGQRGIQNREELTALAHALGTTTQELTTGLGEDGEDVLIVGKTPAVARADGRPGSTD
jgi:hypothetical protein